MQSPTKTMPFYPPPHYKSLQPQEEQDEQYQNEVAVKFLKQKHNMDITRKRLPIEIYLGGPPHEPYFITFILQGQIIIGPTNKMVTSYVVGNLALLN